MVECLKPVGSRSLLEKKCMMEKYDSSVGGLGSSLEVCHVTFCLSSF